MVILDMKIVYVDAGYKHELICETDSPGRLSNNRYFGSRFVIFSMFPLLTFSGNIYVFHFLTSTINSSSGSILVLVIVVLVLLFVLVENTAMIHAIARAPATSFSSLTVRMRGRLTTVTGVNGQRWARYFFKANSYS